MNDDSLETEIALYFERLAHQSPRFEFAAPQAESQRRFTAPLVGAAAVAFVLLAVVVGANQLGDMGSDAETGGLGSSVSRTAGPSSKSTPTASHTPATTAVLLGGRWEPLELAGRPVASADEWDNTMPWIAFEKDGWFKAWDGCNQIRGRYSGPAQGELRFDSHLGKHRGCSNFLHPFDLTHMGSVMEDDRLALLDERGNTLAVYRRVR